MMKIGITMPVDVVMVVVMAIIKIKVLKKIIVDLVVVIRTIAKEKNEDETLATT